VKRIVTVSGIVVLLIVIVGGAVIATLAKRRTVVQPSPAIETVFADFGKGVADALQRVEIEPAYTIDGPITKARLRITNAGKASCKYKLLEYKLAGRSPRGAALPVEIERLDPGQSQEIQLTFENVPWIWNDREATAHEFEKSWSATLPPKNAASDHKLAISAHGEGWREHTVSITGDAFKRIEPALRANYPRIAQYVPVSASASLEGDLTIVSVTCANPSDHPILDFTLKRAGLGGNGDLAGDFDSAQPHAFAEINSGDSRTMKVFFKNAPWDFSMGDHAALNLVVEYAWRRPESIVFRGNRFPLEKLGDGALDGKVSTSLSARKPAAPPAGPTHRPVH
jgi:hypothetical protein